MRLLASADQHFHRRLRFAECIKVHGFIADLAREAKADVVALAGDAYEEESVPEEREAFADFLKATTEHAPVVFSRGNHDAEGDVELMARLQTRHPVIIESGADVHYVAGAAIAAVAWPERANMLALAGSIGGTEELIREAMQAVFRGLGAKLAQHDGPRIGLGHLMIDGSIASTNQPLLGLPINVGLADLDLLGATLGIAGHIHKAQRFTTPSGSIWLYPGSPYRTDFGQTEPKSVVLAEFDGPRLVKVEEIETPATPMRHYESTFDGNGFDSLRGCVSEGEVRGAEVRWRFNVRPDQQEAARVAAQGWADRWLAMGAVSVKLEPQVVTQTRARAPEVAAAASMPEKLAAHWSSIGYDPGERRDPLLVKVADLEQEVRLAS